LELLNNFETAGGLTGDDLLVVVGRDDDVAVLANEFFGLGETLAGGDADVDNFCTVSEGGGAFDGGAFDGMTITALAPTSLAA
jgi:hypothetical protein